MADNPVPDMFRIKNNVLKMVNQQAPESDIDGYIASEGTTLDAVKSFRLPKTIAQQEDERLASEMAMSPEAFKAHEEQRRAQGLGVRGQQPGTLSLLQRQLTDPIGIMDEVVGGGRALETLIKSGFDTKKAGETYEREAEAIRAEKRAARQKIGWGPEILSGFIGGAPARVGQIAASTFMEGVKSAAKIGGVTGGITGFASADGGIENRALEGAKGAGIGAVAGPLISEVAIPAIGRIYGGTKSAFKYANNALQSARNPEDAAINSVADKMVSQGIDPATIRAAVSPPPSTQLSQRLNPLTNQPFSEADMATMISRGSSGETAAEIARDYGLHESTVSRYLTKYRDATPTERNIIDVAKDVAGEGLAQPLTRLARAANSLSDDGEAAQRLLTRQQTQAGRASNIIDRAGAGRHFEEEIARLEDVISNQARQAYEVAKQNAQPFDIKPVISKFRNIAFGKGGELKDQAEKAVDLFFKPKMVTPERPPATELRLIELRETLDNALASGASDDVIKRLSRRMDYAQQQDDFVRADRLRKIGEPISSVSEFQGARQSLDQMIARSMQDGRSTPLTSVLTQLRKELTAVVRNNNPHLGTADDLFSGARSGEKLLQQGQKMTLSLGAPSRQLMKGFEKLTPEQQELFRLGFLQKLQDLAARKTDGQAVVNQFNSPAVRQTIERLFHNNEKGLHKRGQDLIKYMRQEATTTRTKNDILAGSRTAELSADMDKLMQGASAAADLATGRYAKAIGNLSTRLSEQIGSIGSKHVLDILTQTDPAKLLPILNRLAQAAKTTNERNAYVHAIRELRSIQSPAVSANVAAAANNGERPAER